MKLISILAFSFVAVNLVKSVALPDYITVCHTSDPKYNDCIKNSIKNIRLKLIKGIPELDLPSIDPLYIDDLKVFNEKGNNGFQIYLKNILIHGGADLDITKLESFDNGRKFSIDLTFPRLVVSGKYTINGKILTLPLHGDGNFNANFTNYKSNIKILGTTENDNGIERYKITKLNIKIKIGVGVVHLDNILNGDEAITEAINDTINESYKEFANELNPLMEQALENKLKIIGNKFLKQFAYSQLFPV